MLKADNSHFAKIQTAPLPRDGTAKEVAADVPVANMNET